MPPMTSPKVKEEPGEGQVSQTVPTVRQEPGPEPGRARRASSPRVKHEREGMRVFFCCCQPAALNFSALLTLASNLLALPPPPSSLLRPSQPASNNNNGNGHGLCSLFRFSESRLADLHQETRATREAFRRTNRPAPIWHRPDHPPPDPATTSTLCPSPSEEPLRTGSGRRS